jgi:hypothetical protein
MKILGVDPGGTTGLCMATYTDKIVRPLGLQHKKLYPHLGLWIAEADLIIMERVVLHGSITEGKADQLTAVGAVQYMCKELGKPDIVWLTPEERGTVTKKMYVPDSYDLPMPHAKDAYLLILAYALREGMIIPHDAKHFTVKG